MIDALCTQPLLELLRTAMDRGAILGWSVEGHNLILYRSDKRLAVRPLAAAVLLRDWLEASLAQRSC